MVWRSRLVPTVAPLLPEAVDDLELPVREHQRERKVERRKVRA